MKTIRNLMTLTGLAVVIFALGPTGARAQQAPNLSITNLSGTFTLPVAAQWGSMTLPAGNYNLYYGTLSGFTFVEISGTAKGSPHGVVRVAGKDETSATRSVLVCVREGKKLIVRTLDIPSIGTSAEFAMPHASKLVARNAKHNSYKQLAEAPMLFERIPVALIAK